MRFVVFACLVAAFGCQRSDERKITNAAVNETPKPKPDEQSAVAPPTAPQIEQIAPPLDIKNPPPDAIKTSSGLVYKKLSSTATGGCGSPGWTTPTRTKAVEVSPKRSRTS